MVMVKPNNNNETTYQAMHTHTNKQNTDKQNIHTYTC